MSSTIRRSSHFTFAAVAALVACASSMGCSKSAPPAPKPAAAPQSAAAPWSSTSAGIEIGRFGVNEPRADGRACWTAKYSLDIASRTLHVETCTDDDPIARDVTLTAADIQKIETSLAALRESNATSCDDKGSTFLVQIHDQSRKLSHYTDSSNCHKGDMGTIDRATAEALFTTLASIEPASRS